MNIIYCRTCKSPLDASDSFCKKCGANQNPVLQSLPVAQSSFITKFTDNRTNLIIFLFGAILTVIGIGCLVMTNRNPRIPAPVFNPPTARVQLPLQQDNTEIDKIVGDYNACLRRMEAAAANFNAADHRSSREVGAGLVTEANIKNVMDTLTKYSDEFVSAASSAITLHNHLMSNPQFAGNYRETTQLSEEAKNRFTIDVSANVRAAADYRYMERR